MTALVVDTSVVFPLVRGSAHAKAIATAVIGFEMMAPDFLAIEVANAVWKESRFAGLPDAAAQDMRAAFAGMPIELVANAILIEPAARIAHSLRHPVYDCLYLALAVELDCAVLTADKRLATAAVAHPDLAARVRVLATS